MKRAIRIEEREKGWIVLVNDCGVIPMCDYINGKWQTVYFSSVEDAQKAKNDYNEVWNGGKS